MIARDGPRTVVLLHGYPETWWEFRHVIGPLVSAGWRVVAAHYRGAGGSSKPNIGYDKHTMAKDVYRLLSEHLRIPLPIHLVGHDIGMMVAYAFASEYPKAVKKVVLMEAPLPGTLVYNAMLMQPNLSVEMTWHWHLHNA